MQWWTFPHKKVNPINLLVVLIYAVFVSDNKINFLLNFQDWLKKIIWWRVIKLKKLEHRYSKVSITKASFRWKYQITTLHSLYSSISIESKEVLIDPLTLFFRLTVVVDRKPENKTDDYFSYELSPYLLFKDGAMRPAAKLKLKNFLLKYVSPSEPLPGTFKTIADGGAFLWCCKWKENDMLGDIFKKYVDTVRKFEIDVVVFDGCAGLGLHSSKTNWENVKCCWYLIW